VPMSAFGFLVRPPVPGGAAGVPDGPASTALRSVVARIAAIVRCVGIAYVAAQLIIWHEFYATSPWRLAGPVAAVAWAAMMVAYLRRRWPSWQLAALDSAFYLLLALSAGWCVPGVIRGQAASWLFIAMASQLIVLAWFAPAVVSAPVALASGAAFWAGSSMAQGSGASPPGAMIPAVAVLLVVTATIHLTGRQLVYRRAAVADIALAAADQDAQDQFVVLSRNIERREHERLLHDTVLNTLTALARPGGGRVADAVARCQHDVTLMEHALRRPGGAGTAERPFGDLVAAVQAVASGHRARGLTVHVEVGCGLPGGGAIPAMAADAITYATREALSNVAGHAGTGEAWVQISPAAPGDGGARVTIRDRGGGFDQARVGPARLGLRRSITERIADAGGRAVIISAPGKGTEVSLRWPGGASHDGASHGGLVQDMAESQMPRLVGVVGVLLPFILLIQALARPHDYVHPQVPVAVWLGVLAAAGWLLPRAQAGGLSSVQGWSALAVAVGASGTVTWERLTNHTTGTADWSTLGTIWLISLVALSRPARVWVTGALAVFAVHAYFVVHALGFSPVSQTRVAAGGYIMAVVLTVFAALRPTLRTHADIAARRAALANRSGAERAGAAAICRDRTGRLALLEKEALPLLRGIAQGTLDPTDPAVKERCAQYGATLRRALVDRTLDTSGLLAALGPALDTARARGLPLEIQVIGHPGPPAAEVADATLAAVDAVTGVLPPHPVSLTVLAAGDDVELYLTFSQPPADLPDLAALAATVPAAAHWSAAAETDETGAGCLEVRWLAGPGTTAGPASTGPASTAPGGTDSLAGAPAGAAP
jgi:signal transduction histidine kinase